MDIVQEGPAFVISEVSAPLCRGWLSWAQSVAATAGRFPRFPPPGWHSFMLHASPVCWVCLELLDWLWARLLLLSSPFLKQLVRVRGCRPWIWAALSGPGGGHVVLGPDCIGMCPKNLPEVQIPGRRWPCPLLFCSLSHPFVKKIVTFFGP